MNLNVKLDGEEEQTIQYNRFAINIPSGETTFNLNFMNSSLNNQGYIINPVNSVGQNIVTYQPSVALQSFIALPSEPESNIIHNLPVGVTLPVGVPLQSGFLQNHNFVNTSIIIENEDCTSQKISKSSPNLLDAEEIKDTTHFIQADERLNCLPQLNSDSLIKKPCPLEMSIKAANIDLEFEKCEQDVPIIIDSRNLGIDESKLIGANLPTIENHGNVKVPLKIPVQSENISEDSNLKKSKTEITWDNNNGKENAVVSNFQESLICEVEEENEDEEAGVDSDSSENEKSNAKNADAGETSSSEESDGLPLSVALKREKLKQSKRKEVPVVTKKRQKRQQSTYKSSQQNKKRKKQNQVGKDDDDEINNDEDDDEEWSESDDDVLNLKRIKNEFNYKCFYEPKTVKSSNSLILKLEDKGKKFVRVRSCCAKEGCGKKISVKDQSSVYKYFNDLESTEEKNAYLLSCIEYVQSPQSVQQLGADQKDENYLSKLEEKKNQALANIQMEIENESNGNPKLSDEIQNAIEESLKDCIVNDTEEGAKRQSDGEDAGSSCAEEKSNWNYYVILDKWKKKVCMQFLMKLLRITKTKIKQLQRKIQSGIALPEELDSIKGNQKTSKVWKVARLHLKSISCEECAHCKKKPRHQFLRENLSCEDLFQNFKKFFYSQNKKELSLKYPSYKKFLEKEISLSFLPKRDGVCAACENLDDKSQSKAYKDSTKNQKLKLKNNNKIKRKKNSSEHYSSDGCDGDDEPLSKRKALKLRIPLKGINSSTKTSQSVGKQNSKNSCADNKKIKSKVHKEKSKQSMNKGRDVWSLMLLHLETMPFRECHRCTSKKKHRFFDSSFTIQGLFEDYKKYFLKETNSALGLVFPMYEKYFNRNCNYTIMDVDVDSSKCPRCVADESKS